MIAAHPPRRALAAGRSGAGVRILHAPADVGGHAAGLARAERALGLHSDVAVFAAGPYGYEADLSFDLEGRPLWRRLGTRTAFLARAVRRYDVIHFNFGQSLLAWRVAGRVLNELPLLQRGRRDDPRHLPGLRRAAAGALPLHPGPLPRRGPLPSAQRRPLPALRRSLLPPQSRPSPNGSRARASFPTRRWMSRAVTPRRRRRRATARPRRPCPEQPRGQGHDVT